MIRLTRKSRLAPGEVLERAARYFGAGGVGLEETERGSCCVSFKGAGGYVAVTVVQDSNAAEVEVEVESREFEYQAKRFLGSV